ncbi:MAG: serine/threonine-protein kinase [Planctomycetota bacterium]
MSPDPARRRPGGPASTPASTGARPAPVKAKAVADPWIGKVIARCKVLEQVGLGRTAVVYRAHHEALHQDVAIKVLLPEAAANAELVDRFRREGRWIAQIDNENVLKIQDVGVEEGRPFMVVELLEGEEIYDLVQREGALDLTDAMRILRQAAAGLAGIHARDVVHRDIKPQNLFLLEDGTVKVVDFGLAAEVPASKERVGTPHFMAPETCSDGTSGPASDVYSLGISLYMLLTGTAPYAGKSVRELMQAHIDAVPLRPERQRRDLPAPLADLLREMTAKDPAARPTAQEVVRRLDELGGAALQEKGTLKGRRGRRTSRSRAAVKRRERQAAKQGSGSQVVVIAVIVAAVVGGIAFLAKGGGDEGEPGGASSGTSSSSSTSSTGSSGTPGTTPGFTSTVEDPAVTRAREEREREIREREAAVALEKEAADALTRAEQFARDTWHGPADTQVVVDRFRKVARDHKDTVAGAKAKERAQGIEAGEVHPHPDRTWTSVDQVAEVRAAWPEKRAELAAMLEEGKFRDALAALPPEVHDAAGTLAADVRFWRDHVRRLVSLRRRLVDAVNRRHGTAEPLTFEADGDELILVKMQEEGVDVRRGLKAERLPWSAVPAAAVQDWAVELLNQQDAEVLLEEMAFALVHRLEDAFWSRELDLGSHDRGNDLAAIRKSYREAYEKGQ